MGELVYFFDTYAIIEILKGNSNYEVFENVLGFVITEYNLVELHYYFLRVLDEKSANEYFEEYKPYCVDILDIDIKEANKMKLYLKKHKVSFADCLGYIVAKRQGFKYVTGDKEFESLPNVEFVK